jgi:predicted secreted protein
MLKTLILIHIIILLTVLKAQTQDTITHYEIKVDSIFKDTLSSNHTTGYAWHWSNKALVKIIDSIKVDYVSNHTNLIGAGGIEIWNFKAKAQGIDTIKLEYNRIFESNSTIKYKCIIIKATPL